MHTPYRKQINYLIASLWGLAEATFFFFIPDIYLTRIALRNPTLAFQLCFVTALAACVGGIAMYSWGNVDYQSASLFLTTIPAIYPKLIQTVITNTHTHPFYSLFIAPMQGIPYKIYAVAIGASHLSLGIFIVVSFVARLLRFILTTGIAVLIKHLLRKKSQVLPTLHCITWIIIYLIYFTTLHLQYA